MDVSEKHQSLPVRHYKLEKPVADLLRRHWPVDKATALRIAVGSGGCARPDRWQGATLDRIEQETGWRPDDACFAPKGWWNPSAIKGHLLRKDIFPLHGEDARYLAIESNPTSREMYSRFGIRSLWVDEVGGSLRDTFGTVVGLDWKRIR